MLPLLTARQYTPETTFQPVERVLRFIARGLLSALPDPHSCPWSQRPWRWGAVGVQCVAWAGVLFLNPRSHQRI